MLLVWVLVMGKHNANSFMHMLSFAQWCVAYFLLLKWLWKDTTILQESTKFLCNHNCDDVLHCFGVLMIWYQLLANQKCTHYAVPMFLDVWHWHLRLNLQVSPLKSYAGEGGHIYLAFHARVFRCWLDYGKSRKVLSCHGFVLLFVDLSGLEGLVAGKTINTPCHLF